jgi:hypothetical protein
VNVQLAAFSPAPGSPVISFTRHATKANSQTEVGVGFLATFQSELGALAFVPPSQRRHYLFSTDAAEPGRSPLIAPAKVNGDNLVGSGKTSSHDSAPTEKPSINSAKNDPSLLKGSPKQKSNDWNRYIEIHSAGHSLTSRTTPAKILATSVRGVSFLEDGSKLQIPSDGNLKEESGRKTGSEATDASSLEGSLSALPPSHQRSTNKISSDPTWSPETEFTKQSSITINVPGAERAFALAESPAVGSCEGGSDCLQPNCQQSNNLTGKTNPKQQIETPPSIQESSIVAVPGVGLPMTPSALVSSTQAVISAPSRRRDNPRNSELSPHATIPVFPVQESLRALSAQLPFLEKHFLEPNRPNLPDSDTLPRGTVPSSSIASPAMRSSFGSTSPQPVSNQSFGGTLAFEVTLTPVKAAEESTVGAAKYLPASASSDTNDSGSADISPTGGSDVPAPIPNPLETTAAAPPGPVEDDGFADNRQEEPPKPSRVERSPSFPEQMIPNTFVASPAGNTPSSEVEQKAHAPLPEKPQSNSETNPPNRAQLTRDITVKVEGSEMANVDVRLSERGGKIVVSVRSQSPELAQSLRTDLGDLVGRLESRGYRSDTTIPIAGQASNNQPAAAFARETSGRSAEGGQSRQHRNHQEPRPRPQHVSELSTFPLEEFKYDERQLNS